MTTQLKTLEWDNYFSFGSGNRIDFTAAAVTQILGVNGNGKSSIPLILEEVCFNKNSKGISKADIPNRYLNAGTWAKLTFTVNDDDYVLQVDRKSSIKVKLSKNGTDISAHTATATFKLVEGLFGNDFKTFTQLVYQSTTSSLQFLTATDTNRKKFLIELLQLEEYVLFFELFKEAAKDASSNLSVISGKISTVQNWLDANKLEDASTMELLDVNIDTLEDEKELAGSNVELQNIIKSNKERAQNNKYRELLRRIDINEINNLPDGQVSSYDTEQAELGGLQADIKRHTVQLKKLEGLGDSCPTCEQTIEADFKNKLIEEERNSIKTSQERVTELNALIEKIKQNNRDHAYKAERVKEFEDLHNLVNPSIPEELLDKDELESKISNVTIRLANARDKLKKLNEYNEKANKHNSRVAVILEQGQEFAKQLATLQAELAEEQDNVAELELLKKTFSTNGLLAYKIENLVKDLEDLTNEYLAEFSDGRFTIEFSVVSDKLNVNITDNGSLINIVSLSSGELARVNTSTLLAIRKLMNSLSKSKINVLFLDEVISVLDDNGREKLVEILMEEDLNTYLVSHSWSHPLLAKLEVVKEDNISRIEHYA